MIKYQFNIIKYKYSLYIKLGMKLLKSWLPTLQLYNILNIQYNKKYFSFNQKTPKRKFP